MSSVWKLFYLSTVLCDWLTGDNRPYKAPGPTRHTQRDCSDCNSYLLTLYTHDCICWQLSKRLLFSSTSSPIWVPSSSPHSSAESGPHLSVSVCSWLVWHQWSIHILLPRRWPRLTKTNLDFLVSVSLKSIGSQYTHHTQELFFFKDDCTSTYSHES